MRTRSKDSPRNFVGLIGGSTSDVSIPQYRSNFYSSDSYTPWAGQPGPYMIYSSTIQDQVSPEHALRQYNSVTHTSYKAAVINAKKSLTFPAGVPSLVLGVDVDFMYKPSIVVPTAPWATMVDELASLANGNTKSSAALAVTLLEATKTVAMLRNPFSLLKPDFRRHVRKLTARTLANRASGIWLEGYYGWKSLYQDTETIAKATAKCLNESTLSAFEKLGERLCVKSNDTVFSGTTSYVVGTSSSTWSAYSGANWLEGAKLRSGHYARLVNHTLKNNYVLGCRQFMETSRRLSATRRILSAAGLTSWRSIRDTIWEVIPFSFVVDWFVDTRGLWAPLNMLRLGEADIKSLGYSISSTGVYDVDLYVSPNSFYSVPSPWRLKQATQCVGPPVFRSCRQGTYKIYQRSPGEPPYLDVPSIFGGKGLSFIRTMNGTALLAQLFSRSKPKR